MTIPAISIICNTFNHEKYIRDALESFVGQKVSVPFEVLIHDDASTDGTADIVREFEAKYPELIKPIYQKENQYSQGVKITPLIQLPRTRGKYVAFCEGDDYWTDMRKLQTQFDFMEAHLEYSGCCHAYNMVSRDKQLLQVKRLASSDGVVPMACLIGDQLQAPHFATLFLRRECLLGLGGEFLGKGCNDMIIRLYCAQQFPLYYLNQEMSAYRRFAEGSWTLRIGGSQAALAEGHKSAISFLRGYDEITNGKYADEITQCIDWREFEIALIQGDFRTARRKYAYQKASLKRRIYISLGCMFPKAIQWMRKKEK